MEANHKKNKSLFSKCKPNELGRIYGKWKVTKSGHQLYVELFEKGLTEMSSSMKTIQFDFDVKYLFNKDTLEIKLEKGSQTCTYTLLSAADLEQWRQILKTKLNQRGFHQQFKPLKKIGKGNFASVYLAEKLEDKQNYAVKAFSKEQAYSQENGKECLIKQVEVARCMAHKNTMKLIQIFQSENSLYFIFQLLSGGQLYDKVKAKYKFKPFQIKKVINGILKGLREMHSKGIMHRDLKPENLLFRKENQWDCVIADYGLAEFCDADTYLFVRCGTPGYVAPEVINIKDMSTKYKPICDIYSLGLIFHILLFGRSAFNGKTYNQVLSQNRAANIDLSGEQYKKHGCEALELLSLMLKKRPNERISAQKALEHPYFKDLEEDPDSEEQTPKIMKKNPSAITVPSSNGSGQYPVLDSPLLTTANPRRKLDKNLKKDSCVEFQMGKQNVFTGKTQEVDELRSNKVSITNSSTPIRKPKISQFCAQHK